MNITFLTKLAMTSILLVALLLLQACGVDHHADEHGHGPDIAEDDEQPNGPQGGKLFEQDDFAIELVLYETGVPPEYHAYAYLQGQALAPDTVELELTLTRLDGEVNRFAFKPLGDFLRGQGVVAEPHSFDVAITAQHGGKRYQWAFSSYEGRTAIPEALAHEAGIVTALAGSASITETLGLTGRVQIDPSRVTQLRARFPGLVQRVETRLGAQLRAGTVLARVQSNESLQTYTIEAPLSGTVLRLDAQPGMVTSEAPLFVIADLSRVWIELDVFSRDLDRISLGQMASVQTLDGRSYPGRIDWIAPLAAHASQSVTARVVLENPDGQLRPGMFVRADVVVAEHAVDLAVRQSALQRFRDFQVVYARVGDTYEVRMLELGRQNQQWIEVLEGLKPGTEYVVENSYLIKADIEKSGASHDH
ncbi:MAG: efflux RND transporter periplasmic adaptor subunit [Thiohalomonadaceae bacterium]